MGIKGLWDELGPGQRISLSKLAAESYRDHGRPLRLAVDIAIWQFQTQAAQGGTNPAIRTLFYRLLRLMGTPVQPVFVFDGPGKPTFKRNKRSGRGDGVATAMAKRLINLLGFVAHDAPGEAEAECALLQRNGIVDAVLSEDVDTVMFGCKKTLRHSTAEGKRTKTPTHLTHFSLYDTENSNPSAAGLDREGLVLVALMSGGDYLPAGVPRCGIKVASEAARAGFGKSLCQLKRSDEAGIQAWREKLSHELRTNESKYFRTKHKALAIPQDFPNFEVLQDYTHPVVSPLPNLEILRKRLEEMKSPDILGLREFTREVFDWDYRVGAAYFVKKLAPVLLVHRFCQGHPDAEGYVKRIPTQRAHFSTDATPELRVSFVPAEIVPIDPSLEAEGTNAYSRQGLATNSDDELDPAPDSSQTTTAETYDPSKPVLVWVLEDVARKTIPAAVQTWEDASQAKAARRSPTKKTAGARAKKAAAMPSGALNQFFKVTKAPSASQANKAAEPAPAKDLRPSPRPGRRLQDPPREPSKKPAIDGDADNPSNHRRAASSHVLPRTPDASGSHAIVISSSPPAAQSPPSPSPAPRLPSRNEHAAGTLLPAAPAAGPPGLSRVSSGKRQETFTPQASQAGRFKQTTMDMFATRSKPGPRQPSQLPKVADSSRDFTATNTRKARPEVIEIASSPTAPRSPVTEPQQPSSPVSPSKRGQERSGLSPSPSLPAPKKLLVPRVSAVGFFKEVEVEEHQVDEVFDRETARLRSRGIKARVARLSDLSVIDLTQAS